jgi:hypothetical protein
MQVNQNKQVVKKIGGWRGSRPVRVSPAESNPVKPLNWPARPRTPGTEPVLK